MGGDAGVRLRPGRCHGDRPRLARAAPADGALRTVRRAADRPLRREPGARRGVPRRRRSRWDRPLSPCCAGAPVGIVYALGALTAMALTVTHPAHAVVSPGVARATEQLVALNAVTGWILSVGLVAAPALAGVAARDREPRHRVRGRRSVPRARRAPRPAAAEPRAAARTRRGDARRAPSAGRGRARPRPRERATRGRDRARGDVPDGRRVRRARGGARGGHARDRRLGGRLPHGCPRRRGRRRRRGVARAGRPLAARAGACSERRSRRVPPSSLLGIATTLAVAFVVAAVSGVSRSLLEVSGQTLLQRVDLDRDARPGLRVQGRACDGGVGGGLRRRPAGDRRGRDDRRARAHRRARSGADARPPATRSSRSTPRSRSPRSSSRCSGRCACSGRCRCPRSRASRTRRTSSPSPCGGDGGQQGRAR